jgi:putative transposase
MPRQHRYELIAVLQRMIQRGNNRQPAFFAEEDYHCYLDCLREAALGRRVRPGKAGRPTQF